MCVSLFMCVCVCLQRPETETEKRVSDNLELEILAEGADGLSSGRTVTRSHVSSPELIFLSSQMSMEL